MGKTGKNVERKSVRRLKPRGEEGRRSNEKKRKENKKYYTFERIGYREDFHCRYCCQDKNERKKDECAHKFNNSAMVN